MTDEKRVEDLEKRIDELESMVRSTFPSRRDALKLGVAGVAGAAAMSGTASAGSSQVGTIGDSNNLVDVEAEDINVSDTINGASVSAAAAGQAITSDGAGGLTFASVGGGVPPDFSYNDVTNSRDFNTDFTNNTGKALLVAITTRNFNLGSRFGLIAKVNNENILISKNDFNVGEYEPNSNFNISFFVPDGAIYSLGKFGAQDITSWYEAEM